MRAERLWGRYAVVAAMVATILGLSGAIVPLGGVSPAGAQPPSPLQVTFVARVCNSYADIMANKARNNIQESLFNLGPDSTYPSSGIVDPTAEQTGSPRCSPLPGWRMSTGQFITGKSPSTQNLSTVTGLFRSDIVTQASTALLDAQGRPVLGVGGAPATIAGAVTVPLTPAEASFAQSGRTVWVQGGTPTQALNGRTDLGFGALRCAHDALNGDNVDAVTFPQGRTHVFCFYYSVSPPPPAGTITVVKHVTGAQKDDFAFQGNVSYNPGGAFSIAAAPGSDGSVDFIRGATLGSTTQPAWSFTELPDSGWLAPSPAVCVSQNDRSVIGTDGATTTVDLAPGDHVTCTYTNTPTPLGQGVLAKETIGGVGSFPFSIRGPDAAETFTATTTQPDTPTEFASRVGAPSGAYTVTETMPTDTSLTGPGSWSMTQAVCNDEPVPFTNAPTTDPPTASLDYTAAPGADVSCLFTNTFTPSGSIRIFKTTEGGTGRSEFRVLDQSHNLSEVTDPVALTTSAGQEVQASPAATGLSAAPGSLYTIQESMPAPDSTGFWVLASATCGANEVTVDPATASAVVQLTPGAPDAECHFVNRFQKYGSLAIVKTTTPDRTLRPDSATLAVACDDRSFDGGFSVPAGQAGNDSGIVVTNETLVCTVTEPSTGAANDVDVATTAYIEVDGGAHQPYTLGQSFTAELGHDTQVVIANTLSAATQTPTPTPTPTSTPTSAVPLPSGAPGTGLASTGSVVAAGATIALGVAAVAVGTIIVTVARIRRRHRN